MNELSLEAQFSLKSFEAQVKKMNRDQAIQMALTIYEQLLVERVMYQGIIRHKWGIGGGLNENQQH